MIAFAIVRGRSDGLRQCADLLDALANDLEGIVLEDLERNLLLTAGHMRADADQLRAQSQGLMRVQETVKAPDG